MRRIAQMMASLSLAACSMSLQRPLETTEAATDLEQVTRSNANELNPAISPDASALAYETVSAPDAAPRVEVMALRAGAPGEVMFSSGATIGGEPAWKPDGSGVVFVSPAGGARRLVEMLGHGAGRAPFLAPAGDVAFPAAWPALSPDGTVAAAVGDVQMFATGWPATRRYDDALGATDLLGSGLTVLGRGTEPAFSPDGARIAFVRADGGRAHLFVARADGGDAQPITDGAADDAEPAWSPDGRRIVFCSGRVDAGGAHANLFTVQPDGAGLVQLTEGDHLACRPSWGKDGRVYFHADADGRFHVWRLRPREDAR